MFRTLAQTLGGGAGLPVGGPRVFDYHPMQLSRYLEALWINRPNVRPRRLGIPGVLNNQEVVSGVPVPRQRTWPHLIYAYMVENTRAYEIFRRVIEEYVYGERLGTPSDTTQRWLRTTEQLFYSSEAPHHIYTLTSWVRPDARGIRRNAYHRMFGMDLNHGTDDNRPYAYPRTAASNTHFSATFEELLREVWRAVENVRNTSGVNQTDDAGLAILSQRLYDMLTVRRQGGNLNRDEFAHVASMSWFHLTLDFDSSIVIDLEAQAPSAEERLLKIGERVGLPAHSRSGEYFRLGVNMSLILRAIETGIFNNAANVPAFYQPTVAPIYNAMLAIIRDWSIATGRDMKSRPVSVAPPQPVPIRTTPRPIPSAARGGAATNGPAPISRETLPV